MSFTDLPAEVRLRVYSYVFGPGLAEALSSGHWGSGTATGYRPNQRSAQLLAVCKSIGVEAWPIFLDQTTVTITRVPNVFSYLAGTDIYMHRPKLEDVRHLKIDFDPNDYGDVEYEAITSMHLPKIQDIVLNCCALRWASAFPARVEADTHYSYDNTVVCIRELAMAFLVSTRLSLLEEKSITGRQVVIELSIGRTELLDTRVSLLCRPIPVSMLTLTQVPLKVMKVPN